MLEAVFDAGVDPVVYARHPDDIGGDGSDVEHVAAGEVVSRDDLANLLRDRRPSCRLDRIEPHAHV